MAHLQSTTISGSNSDTGSIAITGSTMIFPIIESSLTSSFSGSGKMWVNSDTSNLQYSLDTSLGTVQSPSSFMGAWSTGGSLITGRAVAAGAGTPSAGLAFGGYVAPASKGCTEEYNGTSWAAGGALITARHRGTGGGTQTAAVAAGGGNPGFLSCNETYDGSTWSTQNALTVAMSSGAAAGNASGLTIGFGGGPSNPSYCAAAYQWNGESWSAGGTASFGRNDLTTFGNANDAMFIGGNTGGAPFSCVEYYDGVSWTNCTSFITGRTYLNGAGTTNAGVIMFGGNPTNLACTEEWNGISWVEGCAAPNTTKGRPSGIGSQIGSLSVGGYPSSAVTNEYTKDSIAPYTSCVWTIGTAIITPRGGGAGAGDKDAALIAAGVNPDGRVACTEEYSGTSWSAGGAMIIARSALAGGGTQNAAWAAGGEPAGGDATELYNGSTWASSGALNASRYGLRGTGTQNAAQASGKSPVAGCNETFDGSTWSTATAMPAGRNAHSMAGTSAASILFGGATPTYSTDALLWDGSAWSTTPAFNTCRRGSQAGGTQNDALAFAGYNPANPDGLFSTELYNGTAWSVQGNLAQAGKYGMGTSTPGGAVDSFYAGGTNPAYTPAAQFYNAVCSTTLCNTGLPVWSGVQPMLAASGYGAGFGTQNAAVVATGTDGSAINTTEEFDGTTWTAGGTTQCAAGYGRSGAGTLNAGLIFGGWPAQDWTEEYDGSTWSTANAMINTSYSRGSTGTQTAALAVGDGPISVAAVTEEYDGTNWAAGGALSTARYASLTTGTQNDAVTAGGQSNTAQLSDTEEYNGSSWATGGSMNTARKDDAGLQMFGEGAYSAVYAGGRAPGALCVTEEYDGAVWAFRPNLPIKTTSATRIGTSNAGLLAGGKTPSYVANVYEYNVEADTCIGAWSVKTSIINERSSGGSGGTTSAGWIAAGNNAPSSTALSFTEEYNGTSWAAGGALITARFGVGGAGTQNAALLSGGYNGARRSCTEEYNGASWAAGGNLITARERPGGGGTQNAGLAFGGSPSAVEEYDGSTWASGGSLITGRNAMQIGCTGTQNAGLAMGGTPAVTNTEEYDGTSWTAGGTMAIGRSFAAGAGIQSAALAMGGITPSVTAYTEAYNGINWSVQTPLITLTTFGMGIGVQDSALVAGGDNDNGSAANVFEYSCVNQVLGAGKCNWIGKVNFVTG